MLESIIKNGVLVRYTGNDKIVTIPNSVTSIGDKAFYACESIIYVTIPNSVTSIGYFAFSECKNLTSINIPNSLVDVKKYAFYNCLNLEEIDVDSNNEYYISINGVLFDKDITKIINYPIGKFDNIYYIPSSVTSIDNFAFAFCRNLTSIIIPDSVINIGKGAFTTCENLRSITIPNSVINIETIAFYNCRNLKINIPNSVIRIGEGAFGKRRNYFISGDVLDDVINARGTIREINCEKESCAHKYALDNGIKYELKSFNSSQVNSSSSGCLFALLKIFISIFK